MTGMKDMEISLLFILVSICVQFCLFVCPGIPIKKGDVEQSQYCSIEATILAW